MAFPTTKQCCCGCTLRTGVLILGYLGVIGAILHLMQYATLRIHEADGDISPAQQQAIQRTNPVAIVISGILSVILLYGVYKESRPAILSVVYIQLGLTIFGIIVITVVAFIYGVLWVVPLILVFMLIGFYFMWVEYSYAEELKERSNNPKSFA